jgi:predicted transposase/invertase (TIGR01784 family)
LTDLFELCILELPKVSKYYEKNDLDTWVEFIKNPEVINMAEETNKAVKKAKKVLEDISKDEQERYIAELREKYILDQNSLLSSGYRKGLKEGIEQQNKEIAKKMKDKGMDFKTISELTGLSEEEIKKI